MPTVSAMRKRHKPGRLGGLRKLNEKFPVGARGILRADGKKLKRVTKFGGQFDQRAQNPMRDLSSRRADEFPKPAAKNARREHGSAWRPANPRVSPRHQVVSRTGRTRSLTALMSSISALPHRGNAEFESPARRRGQARQRCRFFPRAKTPRPPPARRRAAWCQ